MNPAELIDHTLLRPPVTRKDIEKLCVEAKDYKFYSVCIPPFYVPYAKKVLVGSDILVCTVIGFPFGYTTSHVKFLEARNAVARGADELDIVINVGNVKDKRYNKIKDEIVSLVNTFKKIKKKVIIETCILTNTEKIEVSLLLKEAGVDYIKTSSGFLNSGATVDDIKLIKSAVGQLPKIKASGGIKSLKTFNEMVLAGASRVGTSSGINIVNEFLKNKQK